MHVIAMCPRCKKDFMYHTMDTNLFRKTDDNIRIKKEYPIQDEVWPSRRWNKDKTEYKDLSCGYIVICQDCNSNEIEIK